MNLRVRALPAYVAIAFMASACSPTTESPADDVAPIQTQRVIVTQDSDDAPALCRPAAVGEVMVSFLQAVNAGTDPTASFASSFQWYSMTEGNPRRGGRHFVAHDLTKLSRYFDQRAAHNESMELLKLSVLYERARDIGHIQYVIERRADDTSDFGTIAHGKGAIACGGGKIELLSMGMAKGFTANMGLDCPQPQQPEGGAAVVCARA